MRSRLPAAFATSLLLAALALSTGACRDDGPQPVLVFAAASLADVLSEVARDFEAETGTPVDVHAAASSLVARQVEAGAPADVVVAANGALVAELAAAGRVVPASIVTVASNTLVVVVPRDAQPESVRGAVDLAAFERVALGDPAAVPVGLAARAWLEGAGAWEAVRPRVLPTADARAALGAVASGAADAGVVYATDARADDRVVVAHRVPRDLTPDVAYVAALVSPGDGRRPRPEAAAFLHALRGEAARRAFHHHGFLAPTHPPGSPS